MQRYRNIQEEVLNDFKINPRDCEIPIKNSIQSTYNTFQYIGIKMGLDLDESIEFADELFDKYELNKYDV